MIGKNEQYVLEEKGKVILTLLIIINDNQQ